MYSIYRSLEDVTLLKKIPTVKQSRGSPQI